MIRYPAQIDNNITLPPVQDNLTPVRGAAVNIIRDAALAIESELGIKPSGVYTTVRARLDALESIIANLKIIKLTKDLGGTLEQPLVIGLQGFPVTSETPQINEILTWNGLAWEPLPPQSAIDVAFGGDLSGNGVSQTVIGLQSRPIANTVPGDGYVLMWNGSAWEPKAIPVEFKINSFSGGSVVEVSQTVNTPAFTASYNVAPDTATLSDSEGNPVKNVISSPTSFASNHNFQKNTFGASVTFTLNASLGSNTANATTSLTWGARNWYGVGAAGQTGEAFIESLTSTSPRTSRTGTFTVNAGSTQKIYYAHRTGYGTASFSVGGFEGGFAVVATNISVTNAYGFTENYTLYESDNVGLGNTTVTVS